MRPSSRSASTAPTPAIPQRSGLALRAPHPLADLARALRRPRFTLYFGRKACPLGLPPAPRIVATDTLSEAFASFDAEMPEAERDLRRRRMLLPHAGPVHADADAREWLGEGLKLRRIERRRDAIVSRRRWQFGLRDELIALPVHPTAGTPS